MPYDPIIVKVKTDKTTAVVASSGGASLDQFARDTANGAFTTANAAFDKANSANVLAQTSRDHANGAFTAANTKIANSGVTVNGSLHIGNTVSGGYDVRVIAQTAPIIVTNGQGTVTLSHASSGVVATTYGNATFVSQVTVDQFGHVTSASNVAIDQSLAQTALDHANGAFTTANSAYAHANGAFASSNTKVANSGVTVNGSVLIGNTVSGGYDMRTLTGLGSVVIVNGQGTISINSNTFSTINTIANDANTQGNLVSVGSDTLILEAGPGINITFTTTNGKEAQFMVNPGYIQAIASGQALHAL